MLHTFYKGVFMKKIVFTLVALAGLLSASEYVNIQNNIVTMSENRNIIGVFKLKDVAYMTQQSDGRNIVALKEPNNAIIVVRNLENQNIIGVAFANYLLANNQ